jgi:tripartite-type tricarboxylate transporter receptor subunit TctC
MRRLCLALAFALLAGIGSAAAQVYPSRPITVIVGFPPGGATTLLGASWPST